ncbi:MAG: rhomboid family intramembrane serine protease [Myxococcales bacterium]|nr:rhomboid family intramembrane serine protease [Myxococcales bacterium]
MTQPLELPAIGARAATQKALLVWLRHSFAQRGKLLPWLMALLLAGGALQVGMSLLVAPWGNIEMLLAGGHVRDALLRGQWWRLLTWTLLHADLAHLLTNVLLLAVVGRPVEAAFGAARLWLIFWSCAFASAIAAMAHVGPWWTVGASGAVIGVLGAMVGLGIKLLPRLGSRLRVRLVALPAAALAILVALGGERSDRLAHIGGAMGGLLLGSALYPQFLPIYAGSTGRRSAPWLRLAAYAVGGIVAAAIALAIAHMGHPLPLAKVAVHPVRFDELTLHIPTELRRGLLTAGNGPCTGDLTDTAWALRTRRIACFPLPVEGTLLLGRRDQLFTLDQQDFEALQRANRERVWVRRQTGTLVAPVGRDWAWVVQAPEPLLATYATVLVDVLPPLGSAQVEVPSAPSSSGVPLPSPASGTPRSPALGPSRRHCVTFLSGTYESTPLAEKLLAPWSLSSDSERQSTGIPNRGPRRVSMGNSGT